MQVRINACDRAPHEKMSLEDQLKFYYFYPKLVKMTKDKKFVKNLNLEPGNILMVYNWRVLHGRTAFQGDRTLSGCYIGHADFMSACRSHDLDFPDPV